MQIPGWSQDGAATVSQNLGSLLFIHLFHKDYPSPECQGPGSPGPIYLLLSTPPGPADIYLKTSGAPCTPNPRPTGMHPATSLLLALSPSLSPASAPHPGAALLKRSGHEATQKQLVRLCILQHHQLHKIWGFRGALQLSRQAISLPPQHAPIQGLPHTASEGWWK